MDKKIHCNFHKYEFDVYDIYLFLNYFIILQLFLNFSKLYE